MQAYILLIGATLVAMVTGAIGQTSLVNEDTLGSAVANKRPRGIDTVARMDFLRRGQYPGRTVEVPPLVGAAEDEDLLDISPGRRVPGLDGYDSDMSWTLWSDWTGCSRTCGGGVSTRMRKCISRYSTTTLLNCNGQPVEHKLCNTQDCPSETPDFREMQCSQQNGKFFLSRNFKWIPFTGKDGNTCELSCVAKNFHFYHSFGLAMDGTKCGEGRKGICIKGECAEVGCDGVIGSKLDEDVCGVCGGINDTCFRCQNVVDRLPAGQRLNSGYNKVATIPIGSTNIKVDDYNKNYLALLEVDQEEEKYIVNGNWIVSWPGEFKTAGTMVKYSRQKDKEILEIAGPTTKELQIVVLCLGHQQPLVQYEYWKPITKEDENDRYAEFKMQKNTILHVPDEENYREQIIAAGLDFDAVKPPTLEPTTETSTTATTTASTTTTTPATMTPNPRVLPRQQIRAPSCTACKKTINLKKRFCDSDFVIHVRVLPGHRLQRRRYIRYEVEILNRYKSNVKMMKREYVWLPSTCCQRLRPYRHYLLMGRSIRFGVNNVISSGSPKKSHQYETRLLVDQAAFWHTWRKYQAKMARVAKHTNCKRLRYHAARAYRRKLNKG